MREELAALVRQREVAEERWNELDRTVKRLEKGEPANNGRITAAFDKIDSISSSIEGHMDLVNVEVNKAIAKIVGFVNDKVSRPLTESIAQVNERLDRLERL
jgi:chromosome segregation ATPase